jgi:hypothetical protein
MFSRRATRAIWFTLASLGVAIATTGGCSLAVSTDGLSGGAADGATALRETSATDGSDVADRSLGANESGENVGVPDADARAFPTTAATWSGNGHAYGVYVDPQGVSWTGARVRAEQAGGHLATLGSSEENDFVKTLVTSRADAFSAGGVGPWLGGWQPSPTPADEPAGGWQWIDGTSWTATDWASSQPDNSGGVENYLDFYRPGGILGWNDDAENGSGGVVISYVVEFE